MTREEALRMLIRLKDGINFEVTDSQKKMDALNMAIKSLEAWEEVKQDLYKFASDSFDAECAECYRIALRCVEGHLKEVEHEN